MIFSYHFLPISMLEEPLLNLKKHDTYKMINIFDILKKNYVLTNGVGETGGYHAQILFSKLFSE